MNNRLVEDEAREENDFNSPKRWISMIPLSPRFLFTLRQLSVDLELDRAPRLIDSGREQQGGQHYDSTGNAGGEDGEEMFRD